MSLFYSDEKWLMMTLASVAISLTVGFVLIQYAHAQTVDNQTTVDTAEFSISVPDNWAYQRGIYSQVGLTPNEFGEFLVNAFKGYKEEMKDGGAYAEFRYACYYPIENAPFDVFVKYQLDKNFHGFNVTSKQNVTIDNEPAVKMYADGIAIDYIDLDYTGIKSVLYWVWHDEKPYTLEYTASVKDFEKYLPQFEQMVKTFKFS